MAVFDVSINALSGGPANLDRYRGQALLVVNVASQCGLTPQYAGLQALADSYRDRGLVVLGVPCNQFGSQEPGTPDVIKTFCETRYGVSFPMTEKVEVNGDGRHPLYQELAGVPDADGHTGDIRWNFEKFLVLPGGDVRRYSPKTVPDDPAIIEEIEAHLPR